MGRAEAKVLLLGLDGATPRLLNSFLDHMPFFSELANEDVLGELEVFYPTLSPMEWSSLFTGKNPGKTGIFYLYSLAGGDLRTGAPLANLAHVSEPTIWDLLNLHGLRTGVVNVPCTYPPRPLDGFLISGFLAPTARGELFYYPPEIGPILREEGYEVDLKFHEVGIRPYMLPGQVDVERVLREQKRITAARVRTAIRLSRAYRVDFLSLIVKGTDNLQHLFWHDKEALLDYYAFVDEQAAKLYDAYEPTHLLAVSDHGFHARERYYFHINTWLLKRGYLRLRDHVKLLVQAMAYNIAFLSFRFLRPTLAILREEWVYEAYAMPTWIDTRRSLAYALECGIFLSEEAREAHLARKLTEELLALRGPGGKRVFRAVMTREELFSGPYLPKLPDLILVPEPEFAINPHFCPALFTRYVHKPYLTGSHKADNKGIFLAHGPGIRAHRHVEVHITDIVPITLYLYGLPLPDDLDGKVPKELFEEPFRRAHEVEHVSSRKLKVRLRAHRLRKRLRDR